ncbi:uncharacterized protein LACBIDRAFT_295001 [Laccaria bicolor S238N-H82]|uniref:Predicted protein n=1 Tax=Laccaria bicolor (strain S238N-H82 / ATCC MYA-4686) TaxID=486041 RepID=B0DKR7_LACBS|nr:uncharacterized protein LACBIDRAFT_295001 [Laccaria bicolor S238N-H82]EDR04787.1 predicted protein [Laccaria bicolor S238N-H82]|eukprot:XP_001884611.1 predicted protein [Laccaria bicolor S238N-H82]
MSGGIDKYHPSPFKMFGRAVDGKHFLFTTTTNITNGSLEFIDVMKHVQPDFRAPAPRETADLHTSPTLRPLFDLLQTALQKADHGDAKLVILDDIATLEWIGFSLLDAKATLIIRQHVVTPGDPDDLFRHLLQMCAYHMDVRPLASGRSGAVSGEVALHLGPSTPVGGGVNLIPRNAALQYKLADNGPVFFSAGNWGWGFVLKQEANTRVGKK